MTDPQTKCGADVQGGQPNALQLAALHQTGPEKHTARRDYEFDYTRDRINKSELSFVDAT